ncbi:MAG: hypothetical protein ACI9DH_001765 [Halioglobus sp.]|jgi:uncharacterized protein YigA (DUF484 family)
MSGKIDPLETPKISPMNDDMVRDYLIEHSDFLQRNPEMLDYLHISHASGSAISLVEKQVGILRERNVEMRRRLNTLTGNARDNDRLYDQTRTLVLALLEAQTTSELSRIYNDSMKKVFKVEHSSLILFGEDTPADRNCRVETLESAKTQIGSFIRGRKAVCGALRKEELSYLFPKSGDIGSAAMMPMYADKALGIIAVGSSDANRYSSTMGTVFLTHVAEVIIRILPRLNH